MGKRVAQLERAIFFTKLSVALTCSWPPSPLITKNRLLLFNALWCTAFASSVALFLPLLAAIYKYYKSPIILGKTVSLASAVAQVVIKMIICRLQQRRFQMLYFDMENFCKHATKTERMVLERYVDKYKYFHCIYILWSFITTAFVICGPLYSSQTFPTHAIYPFSTKHQPYNSLIFFHQSLVGFQASSGMGIDTQVALLLRYATARFELLGIQLRNAKTNSELNVCIQKHIELLRYTKEIRLSIKYLVLATIATTTIAVIFGSLNLIANQPLILKTLYAIVVFSASVELFMYAWPADGMMRMSARAATSVYDTAWYKRDISVQRKVFRIILRSQKLETIGISGVVPQLSLSHYAKYLYTSLSYFNALRIMVGDPSSL
ncbi:odorant receptor 13a-like [Bombus flavifrons]|uniref:odorant receptor 13a-like n=1 Tax=Bombus flavifrons TaxID=103934 RepID=UPI0037043BC9